MTSITKAYLILTLESSEFPAEGVDSKTYMAS